MIYLFKKAKINMEAVVDLSGGKTVGGVTGRLGTFFYTHLDIK